MMPAASRAPFEVTGVLQVNSADGLDRGRADLENRANMKSAQVVFSTQSREASISSLANLYGQLQLAWADFSDSLERAGHVYALNGTRVPFTVCIEYLMLAVSCEEEGGATLSLRPGHRKLRPKPIAMMD